MAYSASSKSIERVKNLLDEVLASKDGEKSWHTSNPSKLAYQIREALVNASKRPETYPLYKDMHSKYMVKTGQQKVTICLRTPAVSPIDKVITSVDRLKFPGCVTLAQVVGTTITHKNVTTLYYPDAQLTEGDFRKLYTWLNGQVKYGFHIIIENDGITLTKMESGDAAWTPTTVQESPILKIANGSG